MEVDRVGLLAVQTLVQVWKQGAFATVSQLAWLGFCFGWKRVLLAERAQVLARRQSRASRHHQMDLPLEIWVMRGLGCRRGKSWVVADSLGEAIVLENGSSSCSFVSCSTVVPPESFFGSIIAC